MKPPFLKRKNFILAIFIVLIILVSNKYQKEVKNLFYSASLPIQNFFWDLGKKTSDFFEPILKIKKLKKENEDLSIKNLELLSELSSLRELKKENEDLRKALDLGLEKEFKLMMVKAISKDISRDLIEINKGSKDGIKKDFPVITSQKVLVGNVAEVYENFSKVMLISDKESSLDGKISGKDISGLVEGEGSFKVVFKLVPHEKDLSKDDTLITSVLGGVFPEGLLIGKIQEVKKTDIDPFQTAEISPFFNLEDTDTLFVITEF